MTVSSLAHADSRTAVERLPSISRRPGQAPPLRVLHVYRSWSADAYGGIEGFLTTLGTGVRRYGIDSRIVYLAPGTHVRRVRQEGMIGYRFPLDVEIASNGISLSLLWAYRRLAQWADLLHFHFPWPYGDLVHLLSRMRTPYVVTYHSDVVRQRWLNVLYTPLMHWFLGRAARVIASSHNYLRTSPVLKQCGDKVRVSPLGLDDSGRGPGLPLRMAYWRHRLGRDFVLFVGVLRYYKGLHVLLQAARQIQSRIVIAGSGPVEKSLRAQAKKLGLSNVTFLGEVDPLDKDALYRLASLFVFPSSLRAEAFGLSLVEAAMYGKAMVSCELGTGTSFINVHEQTGLVIEPGDPQALSVAVNRLLADRRLRETFGRNGRKRYLDLFTADTMAERYAAEYHDVFATGGSAWKR
jgi:glycosyltransferase involved in cell wall biosynthesis